MSQAFVRESDDRWLQDVPPTLNALIVHLTQENNGVRVYERRKELKQDRELHVMSNGLAYMLDDTGKWMIFDE